MPASRVLPGAIVVAAVAVASVFAAAPASAATLPPGQKISVVDTLDDQFYNVNPASALSTPVGTPDGIDQEVTGVDVDDVGTGYAVATQVYRPDQEAVEKITLPWSDPLFGYVDGGYIYKADANSGKLTDGKQVLIAADDPEEHDEWADECSAIDYSKGVILAVCYVYAEEEVPDLELDAEADAEAEVDIAPYWDDVAYIGTVDVSDPDHALLTPVTTLTGYDYLYLNAIALNPVDNKLWGFDYYYGASWIVTLDDAFPSYVDDVDNYDVWGADFDRGGQLWISVSERFEPSIAAINVSEFLLLATFDFATDQPVEVGSYASADPYAIDIPLSITVWGVLAATGSTMSATPAIAASGILLLGALLAAGAMVLRRRSVDA